MARHLSPIPPRCLHRGSQPGRPSHTPRAPPTKSTYIPPAPMDSPPRTRGSPPRPPGGMPAKICLCIRQSQVCGPGRGAEAWRCHGARNGLDLRVLSRRLTERSPKSQQRHPPPSGHAWQPHGCCPTPVSTFRFRQNSSNHISIPHLPENRHRVPVPPKPREERAPNATGRASYPGTQTGPFRSLWPEETHSSALLARWTFAASDALLHPPSRGALAQAPPPPPGCAVQEGGGGAVQWGAGCFGTPRLMISSQALLKLRGSQLTVPQSTMAHNTTHKAPLAGHHE